MGSLAHTGLFVGAPPQFLKTVPSGHCDPWGHTDLAQREGDFVFEEDGVRGGERCSGRDPEGEETASWAGQNLHLPETSHQRTYAMGMCGGIPNSPNTP